VEKLLKQFRPVSLPFSSDFGYILGSLFGDGCLHLEKNRQKWMICLDVKDKEFAEEFAKAINRCFKNLIKNSATHRKPVKPFFTCGRWHVRIQRDEISRILINFSFGRHYWRISNEMFNASSEFRRGLLRGFFDAEGSVNVKRRAISACSTNMDGLIGIQKILESLGIDSIVYRVNNRNSFGKKPKFYLMISRAKNIISFAEQIGFSIPRKKNQLAKIVLYLRSPPKPWSEEEIKLLKENIHKMTPTAMAKNGIIKRHPSVIRRKAKALGLIHEKTRKI
jgi:intein-encoded DNA endonuclease-like protein